MTTIAAQGSSPATERHCQISSRYGIQELLVGAEQLNLLAFLKAMENFSLPKLP